MGFEKICFLCRLIETMETIERKLYETPLTMIVEVRHEGIVCASEINGGNSIDNWGNGGTTDDDIYL